MFIFLGGKKIPLPIASKNKQTNKQKKHPNII